MILDVLFSNLFCIVGIVVLVAIVVWIILLRTVVEPAYADVVVGPHGGTKIYTSDASVVPDGQVTNPVYYKFPWWVPKIGVTVRRMPLSIIDIPVRSYETFAKGNARFVVDVTVYCKIKDIAEAARRFPGRSIKDFQMGIQEIVISAVRKTTANYSIEDVIAKREEISNELTKELAPDFVKFGVELTNVAIVSIRDPDDGSSTVIHDISAKQESQINSTSRKEVANQNRAAEMIEAETYEEAEKRKIEAQEQVAMRDMDKRKRIAEQEQAASEEEMKVYNIKQVKKAEIDAEAAVKKADGEKRATIERATGQREYLKLEGEGTAKKIELEGNAEANVTRVTMLAEAEGTKAKLVAEADGMMAKAKAQEYQQEKAKVIRMIEKDERIGLALAEALQKANIEYIGSGNPKNFMDLFSVTGGLNVGGMLKAIEATDPDLADKVVSAMSEIMKDASDDKEDLTATRPINARPTYDQNIDKVGETLNDGNTQRKTPSSN